MSVAEQFEYPPYVLEPADRERWDMAKAIAERQVELYEAQPDTRYVWFMTRWLYESDVPTGTQADQDAAASQAEQDRTSLGLVTPDADSVAPPSEQS